MTERTCAGCLDNPVRDNVTICRRCENQTRYNLADQAAHYEDLLVALTRMVKMNASNDGGKAASRALGWVAMGDRYLESFNEAQIRELIAALPPARPAADAMHSQRSLLVSWSRLLVEEDIASGYPADTIPAMACFIEAALPRLRMHECAGELVVEMKALNGQIMKAIDTPQNRQRVHVGPCPQSYTIDVEPEPCEGQVDAIFPRDEEQRPVLRCGTCRTEWTAEHWEKVGKQIMARMAS